MFTSSVSNGPDARPVRGAATLVAALWCGIAWAAEPEAEAALRTMHEATRTLSYDGVFVYQRLGARVTGVIAVVDVAAGPEASGRIARRIGKGLLVVAGFDVGQVHDGKLPLVLLSVGQVNDRFFAGQEGNGGHFYKLVWRRRDFRSQ